MSNSPARFKGSLEQLRAVVALLDIPGQWEIMPNGYRRYRCETGAILNWWPSRGTINFQGPPRNAADLRHALIRVLGGGESAGKKLLEHNNTAYPGEDD